MPCPINLPLFNGLVALSDGCPNPCKLENTFFRNFSVMYGLAYPVDTSHQINLLSKELPILTVATEHREIGLHPEKDSSVGGRFSGGKYTHYL